MTSMANKWSSANSDDDIVNLTSPWSSTESADPDNNNLNHCSYCKPSTTNSKKSSSGSSSIIKIIDFSEDEDIDSNNRKPTAAIPDVVDLTNLNYYAPQQQRRQKNVSSKKSKNPTAKSTNVLDLIAEVTETSNK